MFLYIIVDFFHKGYVQQHVSALMPHLYRPLWHNIKTLILTTFSKAKWLIISLLLWVFVTKISTFSFYSANIICVDVRISESEAVLWDLVILILIISLSVLLKPMLQAGFDSNSCCSTCQKWRILSLSSSN